MTMDEKFVELIGKSQEILQKYGCANIYEWALERQRSGEITREKLEKYLRLYERYFHRRSHISRVSDEYLEEAENLYQLILEWEAEEKARQEEARQEAALYEGEEYIKEGDYVLFPISGFGYAERSAYDVYMVVENLALKPVFGGCARPIREIIVNKAENIRTLVIPGGLPGGLLSSRHPYVWTSEYGHFTGKDGIADIYIAGDTYDWKSGLRRFRRENCRMYWAIPACFDPEKPLPMDNVKKYLEKHYDGESERALVKKSF